MEHGNPHSEISQELKASNALFIEVRAAFVRKGSSLRAWCIAHEIHRQNAAAALKGRWTGPKATALIAKVTEAAFS